MQERGIERHVTRCGLPVADCRSEKRGEKTGSRDKTQEIGNKNQERPNQRINRWDKISELENLREEIGKNPAVLPRSIRGQKD